MRSLLVSCGLAVLLMAGCGTSNSNNSNTSNSTGNSTNTGATSTPAAPRAKGDFSTPKAAVETFIAAGTARDADLISRCFDASSPGEFRKLREKTASPKELDELATFVQGAQVIGVQESGADLARVGVKFKERNEEITMKKSADGWKIVDF